MKSRQLPGSTTLCAILLLALGLRLLNIGFGLPSMYDPDEPFFMLKSVELLQSGSLNPRWFGHPGSTTIYVIALSNLMVIATGWLAGWFASVREFVAWAYLHPEYLFLPARLVMVAFALASVWLTYAVARPLFGRTAALMAAAFLAVNSLHIAWSQVVRTDIQASVFMLAGLIFANRIALHGRLRDYVWAALLVGFATATKWPAITAFVAVVGASAYRLIHVPSSRRLDLVHLAVASLLVPVGVFLASPYIFLDWQTVIANVSGEVRPTHLGHTGRGLVLNLLWYFAVPAAGSMGWLGTVFALAGVAIAAVKTSVARWTLLPVAILFLLLISSQDQIWTRWVLPVIPFLSIFAAVAVASIAHWLDGRATRIPASVSLAILFGVSILPSVVGAWQNSVERSNDTRSQAAAWAAAHIPAGSTVAVEHLELKLRSKPWRILFPIGEAGCVDGVEALRNGLDYDQVQQLRKGSPIIDLGNVSSAKVDSCRADYLILTYFDLYRTEADRFPTELRNYAQLIEGGRTVALFTPERAVANGPTVRIVAVQRKFATSDGPTG